MKSILLCICLHTQHAAFMFSCMVMCSDIFILMKCKEPCCVVHCLYGNVCLKSVCLLDNVDQCILTLVVYCTFASFTIVSTIPSLPQPWDGTPIVKLKQMSTGSSPIELTRTLSCSRLLFF